MKKSNLNFSSPLLFLLFFCPSYFSNHNEILVVGATATATIGLRRVAFQFPTSPPKITISTCVANTNLKATRSFHLPGLFRNCRRDPTFEFFEGRVTHSGRDRCGMTMLMSHSLTTSSFYHSYRMVQLFQPKQQRKGESFLSAKKGSGSKNKKKKGRGGGAGGNPNTSGGFGKVATAGNDMGNAGDKENGDYVTFPALNEDVQRTIEPSSAKTVTKDLSQDIYNRIAHIYGLENFNYPDGWFDDENDEKKTEAASLSLNDILSSKSDDISSKPSILSSAIGSLSVESQSVSSSSEDFSDLISLATGGGNLESMSPKNTAVERVEKSQKLHISNLPPFSNFRVLHLDPMVLVIDDFFSSEECDRYVDLCATETIEKSGDDAKSLMVQSKTVGKDSVSKAQRTSTTWFHHFKSVPELMSKASRLMGLEGIERWEEPQVVRYRKMEKFTWHLDALSPSESLSESGGQRMATLLVYLRDIVEGDGGSTIFRDLGEKKGDYLKVQPKKGSALLFFPAAGGIPKAPFDIRTLHAGEVVGKSSPCDKWITQLWLRENGSYSPSAPPNNSYAAATRTINNYCDM